jgi:hypothetical protein
MDSSPSSRDDFGALILLAATLQDATDNTFSTFTLLDSLNEMPTHSTIALALSFEPWWVGGVRGVELAECGAAGKGTIGRMGRERGAVCSTTLVGANENALLW